MLIKVLLIVLCLYASAYADPFLQTNNISYVGSVPNYCYVYIDGSGTPIKTAVSLDGAGQPYCRVDVSSLSVGVHTILLSVAYEIGGVASSESSAVNVGQITKEACTDASVCMYKYQLANIVLWYK